MVNGSPLNYDDDQMKQEIVAEDMWTDQRVEGMIGNLLRAGVAISALVVSLGGSLYLLRHAYEAVSYRTFHGEPEEFRHVSGILRGTLELQARGMIQLGLLLLISTPIVRVMFSVFAFGMQRDRMYMAFTLLVLAVLLYSLIG